MRAGSKGIIELAQEKVFDILKTYKSPEVPLAVNDALNKYIKDVSKRSLEDYAKLEGLSNAQDPQKIGDFQINDQ